MDRVCSQCGRKLSAKCHGDKCLTCFNRAKANGTNVSCEQCGALFYLTTWRARYKHHFCCNACQGEWKKRQPSKASTIFQCLECGQTVVRFKSQGVHKFCSRRCTWIWDSKNRRGENAAGYIDGRMPFRRLLKASTKYDEWRLAVFERDQWKCRKCGNTGRTLQVHHIIPFRRLLTAFKEAYPSLDYDKQKHLAVSLAENFDPFWDLSNGMVLCQQCHAEHHPNVNLFGADSRQLKLF